MILLVVLAVVGRLEFVEQLGVVLLGKEDRPEVVVLRVVALNLNVWLILPATVFVPGQTRIADQPAVAL